MSEFAPAEQARPATHRHVAALLGVALAIGAAFEPARAATVVATFKDWTLYANQDQGGKLCFLAAQPASSEPSDASREATLFYISAWASQGVKSEISVKLGFAARKSTDPVVGVVGAPGATFKLFVKNDRAFVADATAELKLIDAMKKGSKLTVQAVSEKGTIVIDTYSLSGITAALQALAAGCP